MGAQFMATGHYARVQRDTSGVMQLLRGVDRGKDQSYVLHMLNQEQLSHSLFPLGDNTKPEVRQLAREFNLPVAERADSQDLCFLGRSDYSDFLSRHAPQVERPGPILTQEGNRLGQHRGLAFYTIGQRKGLGISAPAPLYVLEKDSRNNALIVGPAHELGRDELVAGKLNWVSGEPPAAAQRAEVQIRYKARPALATLTPIPEQRIHVRFDEALRDITPGQAAVFYDGEKCLGGGTIERS
jgi:tRNA-specific 2-thiouridylase